MAENNQLLSIAAELESNAERIREKLGVLAMADDAAKEFLSWMGPVPRPVEQKELTDTFHKMYSIGAFAFADWLAAGEELERQCAWLREAHAVLGN